MFDLEAVAVEQMSPLVTNNAPNVYKVTIIMIDWTEIQTLNPVGNVVHWEHKPLDW